MLFIIIGKRLAAVWALVSGSMGKLVMAPFDPVCGSYGFDEISKWSIGAAYNGIAEQFKAGDFLHCTVFNIGYVVLSEPKAVS